MALPNVHYLEFSEGNSPTDDPERFNVLWQLIDVSKPPLKTNNSDQWRGIFEGDLIVFSSLLSGAGEFEAVRFVGPKSEDDILPLLPAGIEHPEFPTLIVQVSIICVCIKIWLMKRGSSGGNVSGSAGGVTEGFITTFVLTHYSSLIVIFQNTLDGRGEGNVAKRYV